MNIKKSIAAIAIGSLLAVSLCGCSGQNGGDASKTEGSTEAASQSSAQESSSESKSVSGGASESKAESSSADASKSAEGSKDAGSSSKQEGSSESNRTGTTQTTETTQTEQSGDVVYNEDGDVIETPTKYLSTSQITVDISDKDMASTGEIQQAEIFTDLKSFESFYNSSKDKYCLEKTDSGKGFKDATENFDEDFFKVSGVLVIVQSFDKVKGMEIGDTHKESSGVILDIYKDKPASKDKTAYVANIIIYKKSDLSKMPEIKVYPAGELYTDESDPDVIVSLGDDEEEESHDISITEDGDIVYAG